MTKNCIWIQLFMLFRTRLMFGLGPRWWFKYFGISNQQITSPLSICDYLPKTATIFSLMFLFGGGAACPLPLRQKLLCIRFIWRQIDIGINMFIIFLFTKSSRLCLQICKTYFDVGNYVDFGNIFSEASTSDLCSRPRIEPSFLPLLCCGSL